MKFNRIQSISTISVLALLGIFAFQGLLTLPTFSQEPVGTVLSQTETSLPSETEDTEANRVETPASSETDDIETNKTETLNALEPGEWILYPDDKTMSGRELVRVGSNQRLGPDETAREMVTILGDAEMLGNVERDMVTVFGDAFVDGIVAGDMVTVFGSAEIHGTVNRDMVVVFGSLNLGPDAVLNGDCVVVFGEIHRDLNSVLSKDAVEILPQLAGLKNYITRGLLLGRLIPPGSWLAWTIVLIHLVLYLLVALIVPKPTAVAVRQLDQNLLLCFGVGLLTMILLVPLNLILLATGIGIILLPLVGLAHIALSVLGKTATLEFFGFQILGRFGVPAESYRITSFFIGFLIVSAVYMVPIVGLLVFFLLGPLALGAGVLAVFRSLRKNGNGNHAPGIPVNFTSPSDGNYSKTEDVPPPPPAAETDNDRAGSSFAPLSSNPHSEHTGIPEPEPAVMPRAGFWIRLGAVALDAILLCWIFAFAGKLFILFWLAYHIAMWTWKGTTIGGIICRLKVVRLDGRSLDFATSFVRSLAAFFSAIALGLGFFWVGWTRNRQSWHDMIAGTVIVRVPQSIHLI